MADSLSVKAYQKREYLYLAKLVQQEKNVERFKSLAADIKHNRTGPGASLRGALVDPVVNMEIKMLRERLLDKERRISELQEQVDALMFNAKDTTGQRMVKKLKDLQLENQELAKQLSEDRLQDVLILVRAEKKRGEELQGKMKDMEEVCGVLDAENERLMKSVAHLRAATEDARFNALREPAETPVPPPSAESLTPVLPSASAAPVTTAAQHVFPTAAPPAEGSPTGTPVSRIAPVDVARSPRGGAVLTPGPAGAQPGGAGGVAVLTPGPAVSATAPSGFGSAAVLTPGPAASSEAPAVAQPTPVPTAPLAGVPREAPPSHEPDAKKAKKEEKAARKEKKERKEKKRESGGR
mmetsp:Transcript_57803/g.124338  ORF Transcript_57803/g.124338 Transcript_57803/m.124338 type:complete len:353 (+) Transcript_57803:28-1086(+)